MFIELVTNIYLGSLFQSLMTKFNNDLDEKLNKFIRSSFQLVEKMDSVIPIGILESGK